MLKNIFKGVLYAVMATLVSVLAFAVIIKWANLSDGIIKPVIQAVKVLCILLGVGITLKKVNRMGWLYGGIVGILYTVFAFLIFAAVDWNFAVNLTALNDLLFAAAVGVFSAVLFRIKSKNIEA